VTNILVLTSSYRKKGNSNLLAAEVAAGAREAGHAVTVLDLARMTIHGCRDCGACEGPSYAGCAIKDDMATVYPALLAADGVILVSPIYWCNISGQMKQCLDRWKGIAPDREHNPLRGKRIGAVFSYGDTDVLTSGCANAIRSLQDMCAYAGADWLGAVYGTAFRAGDVRDDPALLQRAARYGASL